MWWCRPGVLQAVVQAVVQSVEYVIHTAMFKPDGRRFERVGRCVANGYEADRYVADRYVAGPCRLQLASRLYPNVAFHLNNIHLLVSVNMASRSSTNTILATRAAGLGRCSFNTQQHLRNQIESDFRVFSQKMIFNQYFCTRPNTDRIVISYCEE